MLTDGDDYSAMTTAQTNLNGDFSIKAKSNSEVLLWAQNSGIRSNMEKINSGTSNSSVTNCLSIADLAITITLTWGYDPKDLDAHLFGPNYELYWDNRGDLNGYPWARLDVDDQYELGPEVFTITSFPDDGLYSYKVNNYYSVHNTGGMFGSGAKVEFNFNGPCDLVYPSSKRSLTNNSWNVFDLDVVNNSFLLIPVQTWSKTIYD